MATQLCHSTCHCGQRRRSVHSSRACDGDIQPQPKLLRCVPCRWTPVRPPPRWYGHKHCRGCELQWWVYAQELDTISDSQGGRSHIGPRHLDGMPGVGRIQRYVISGLVANGKLDLCTGPSKLHTLQGVKPDRLGTSQLPVVFVVAYTCLDDALSACMACLLGFSFLCRLTRTVLHGSTTSCVATTACPVVGTVGRGQKCCGLVCWMSNLNKYSVAMDFCW